MNSLAADAKERLRCEIHQTATVMPAMEDKPVRFAIRGGVVKGDHSAATFRG